MPCTPYSFTADPPTNSHRPDNDEEFNMKFAEFARPFAIFDAYSRPYWLYLILFSVKIAQKLSWLHCDV